MLHSSTYLSLLGIVPRAEPGGVKRANTTFRETQPGYVIVVSDRLDLVIRTLREIPEFTRLLKMGESFVPLAVEERARIEALSNNHNRCIEMSMGVIEHGRVVVQSGPLCGREAMIVSVNRHKNVAFVEFEICGRMVKTKVGLGIVNR